MKRILVLVLILNFVHNTKVSAQKRFVENYKLSVFSGLRDTRIDSFPNTGHVDFMNYLYDFHTGYDYEYVGISGHLWFRNNWETDINIAMYDDFAPDNLKITAQYFPCPFLGVSFRIYTHTQLMNDFTRFHRTTAVGFYGDMLTNIRQVKLHDRGTVFGLILTRKFGVFHPSINLNAGISSFKPFAESVFQKAVDGNFIRKIEYQTKNTWNLYFLPEFQLDIDCIRLAKIQLGTNLKVNMFYSGKSIDYLQTTYEWTEEYKMTEKVSSPRHNYRKFDIDLGIYIKW